MATYYLDEPRAEADIRFKCHADPVLFKPWEEMPKKAQNEFTRNGPIPCEGGGVPGEWCLQCRFGASEKLD